jgi:predicted nucleic acid-binding protein
MRLVFLDTVGLLALWDANDQWNSAANAAYRRIRVPSTRFVTSTFVLLECGNAAARRPYRRQVDLLRVRLSQQGNLIVPSAMDWDSAWSEYVQGSNKSPGIVDLVSFEMLRRLGITEAFTNDRHFRAAGFVTLF